MPAPKKKVILKKKPAKTELIEDDDVVGMDEEEVVVKKPKVKLTKKTEKVIEEDEDEVVEVKPKKSLKNLKKVEVEEEDEEEDNVTESEDEVDDEEEDNVTESEDEVDDEEEVESEEEEDEEEEIEVKKPKSKKSPSKSKSTSKSKPKTKLKKATDITYPENGQLTRNNLITAVYNLVTDEDYDDTDKKEVARHISNQYVDANNNIKKKVTKRDIAAMILCLEEVITNALSHNCRIRLFNGVFKTKQIEAKVYSGKLIQERMDKGNGDDTLTFAHTRASWFAKINAPEQPSVKGRIIREKTNKKPGQFRVKGSKDIINF